MRNSLILSLGSLILWCTLVCVIRRLVRKNKDGGFAVANSFDPMISGSITILGTSGDEVGGNLSTAVSLVSGGKTIVTETTHSRNQDNFDETSVSFQNAPGAI